MMTVSDLTTDDIVDALHDLRLSDKRHLTALMSGPDGVQRLIVATQRYVDGWTGAVSMDWYKLNRAGLWIARTPAARADTVKDSFSAAATQRGIPGICTGEPIDLPTVRLVDDAMTFFLLGLWGYRAVNRTKAEPFTPPPYAL
jgi:hypothetical protein